MVGAIRLLQRRCKYRAEYERYRGKGPSGFKREAIRKGFLEEVICELDGFPQEERYSTSNMHRQEVLLWERAGKMKSQSPWKTSQEKAAAPHWEATLPPHHRLCSRWEEGRLWMKEPWSS